MSGWNKVLETDITELGAIVNTLATKGNLVYEYNPFRNLRLSEDKYLYRNDYYTLEELKSLFNIAPSESKEFWIKGNDRLYGDAPVLYLKGQLVDFITDKLKVSLDHPINIIPLYSYDGSVNLILNDGNTIPKLINSRFSATGKNTYEIVDRKGNNDTNIYDDSEEQFDIDTSLYKIVNNIPKLTFLKTSSGGNLKVGNYHFYFKLADADGNETDFIMESGLVSVFIGEGSYRSVHTGTKNENSGKQVEFSIGNIDSAYDYIIVYFSRSTAELGDNRITEYVRIDKKFPCNNLKLVITGFEEFLNVSLDDINLYYNLIDAAKTLAVCQNMLFLGNVHKCDVPYNELLDLSLRILPLLGTEDYNPELNENYISNNFKNSYANPEYIYNHTGYWPEEFYRFGIVYILPNGLLTLVFNVRGACEIGANNEDFTVIPIKENDKRRYIKYNEKNYLLVEDVSTEEELKKYKYENVKGVCSFKINPPKNKETGIYPKICYVKFEIPAEVKLELKQYVRGYFFVRLERIPLILAQGITLGLDNEARIPTIPTRGGILDSLSDVLELTHVETEDIKGVNYISEGFLKRYSFTFKKKSSSLWGKIGKIMGVTALIVGAAAAALYTGGASFMFAGTFYSSIIGPVAGVVGGSVAVATASVGIAAGAAAGIAAGAITGVVASTQELGQAVDRIGAKKKLNGRATKAPGGYKIVETEDSRTLTDVFEDRIIIKDSSKNKNQCIICPDYTLNQPYYNLIFTGNEHLILEDLILPANNYFDNNSRHFYINGYINKPKSAKANVKLLGVPDNIVCSGIDNLLFRTRAGEAEEAWRYKLVGKEWEQSKDLKINTDIVRGAFSPYLACTNNFIDSARIVNIYIPGYESSNILEYMQIRMNNNSSYFAITDRKDINDFTSKIVGTEEGNIEPAYRGDCYLCLYTLRINRNFNDPSAPYNDTIIDVNTWKDNYDPGDSEKYALINLGDINAVPLGMWVTFCLRSSNNLNIRTLDLSNVDECAMTGHPNGYFPVLPMSVEGVYKKAESQIYNKGFAKSLSDRWNVGVPDVPHIKNWFGTRIMYSDIHINDAYKNGFRVFLGTHYRDYTREYGEIVKLIPFESSLLCVFEHGIALIPVNERAVAGQGSGGNVYINTSNVLPENPKIISDMFGSQWPESVLKVPGRTGDAPQYVYGVDTVAKKIWRTDGNSIECISDFKVQEFLNNNITLGERELTPIIGIRNVKTHYNAFKRDVMFTFYDNTYGFEEKVWNLCWNELLQKFVTFYSWVPSYMENINNIPFSFNRDTSKWIAKLGVSHKESSFADGITLTNVIIDDTFRTNGTATNNTIIPVEYITKLGETKIINVDVSKKVTYPAFNGNITREEGLPKFIAGLSLSNRILPDSQLHYRVDFSLERDSYGNHKLFRIIPLEEVTYKYPNQEETSGVLRLPEDAMFPGATVPIYALCFNDDDKEYFEVYYLDNEGNFLMILDENNNNVYTHKVLYSPETLYSELYYRNAAGNVYADYDDNKLGTLNITNVTNDNRKVWYDLPIFKDITGKRPTLPKEEQVNPDKLVTLLNIKATISILDTDNKDVSMDENYYNMKASYASGTSLIDAGHYESTVAITPKWNMQFLSTDFWKHGLAGLIDIADDIYPTYWYGKQHPFEFECIVVNDPSTHKIFLNLELVANKAKPESFHYEVIGESYDFAKDKVNMYFRLEATKALWLYNGADICYDRNFLKVQPRQLAKSADLPHTYYTRQDTINDVEDYYINITYPKGYDYRHLSGGEITYYPNRQEYRVWNHAKAISLDDLSLDDSRSIITANCKYLEDRWKITINPILVCYKNEYLRKFSGSLIQPQNSVWTSPNRPKLPVMNSPIPDKAYLTIVDKEGIVEIPKELTNLGYTLTDMDTSNWLNDVGIYKTSFGEALNRKELDLKDKFMKVRIRYSGEELAVIDFLNTIYRISYA